MLRHGKRSNLNLQPPVICFLCVSKNECFHLGEINNEVEHSIFSVVNFFVISRLENLLNLELWYIPHLKDIFIFQIVFTILSKNTMKFILRNFQDYNITNNLFENKYSCSIPPEFKSESCRVRFSDIINRTCQ